MNYKELPFHENKKGIKYLRPSAEFPLELREGICCPDIFYLIHAKNQFCFRHQPASGFQVIYTKRGCGRLIYGNESYDLVEGTGCYIDCMQDYSLAAESEVWSYTVLAIQGEAAALVFRQFSKEGILFSEKEFPDFEERQFAVLRYFTKSHHNSCFDLSCHTYHLLTRLLHAADKRSRQRQAAENTVMMQILTELQQRFSEDVRIDELAQKYHFSASHFRRLFSECTGVSPREYLSDLRICHAEHLLKNTDKSVWQIGAECGFNSNSYFIQIFRKYSGMTPKRYRLKCRNGDLLEKLYR